MITKTKIIRHLGKDVECLLHYPDTKKELWEYLNYEGIVLYRDGEAHKHKWIDVPIFVQYHFDYEASGAKCYARQLHRLKHCLLTHNYFFDRQTCWSSYRYRSNGESFNGSQDCLECLLWWEYRILNREDNFAVSQEQFCDLIKKGGHPQDCTSKGGLKDPC